MRERFFEIKKSIEEKIPLSFGRDYTALSQILFYLDEEERIENSPNDLTYDITVNYFNSLLYCGSIWGLHHLIRLSDKPKTKAINDEKVAIETKLIGFFLECQYHFLASGKNLFEIELSSLLELKKSLILVKMPLKALCMN